VASQRPRRGTPVEVALLNGHRELAGQFLALGARPAPLSPADTFVAAVLAGNERWNTALHVAAETGDLALARTLLESVTRLDVP